MADSVRYPSVEDVLAIHSDILSEYSRTDAGGRNRGDIEFALQYVGEGVFGTAPGTIHEQAFHLLRLLVANHPFVDANKRTALNTAAVCYFLGGHHFGYDEEVRAILRGFGTDEADVDKGETIRYLRSRVEVVAPPDRIEVRHGELVRRVAAADRDAHRDIYDALEDE